MLIKDARMRGDIVHRVYEERPGRAEDLYLGTFRDRLDAEVRARDLKARADSVEPTLVCKYYIREHIVDVDFEPPPLPKPRDRYLVKTSPRSNQGHGTSTAVEVVDRLDDKPVAKYLRWHAMLQTFEPFRQGNRNLALISTDYTKSAVLDLATGEILGEETQGGFCPVGFYVPDWWDLHDGRIIPGSANWDEHMEWPSGDFGFVWGCEWGDDRSWKVQYLDLSRATKGIIVRDDRFGYVELATTSFRSPVFLQELDSTPSQPPGFIDVSRHQVRFAVELDFDLETGAVDPDQVRGLTPDRNE